jgi:hypothetical protein
MRLRKSSEAKIDKQRCENSLATAPKCIGEDSGSIGWRERPFYRLGSHHF